MNTSGLTGTAIGGLLGGIGGYALTKTDDAETPKQRLVRTLRNIGIGAALGGGGGYLASIPFQKAEKEEKEQRQAQLDAFRLDPSLVIGHRGVAFTHPENTVEAIQAAADAGVKTVELDVKLTKDGYPVMCHDPSTIVRLRDKDGFPVPGRIIDYPLANLKSMSAGAVMSPKFKNIRIATLQEALDAVQERKLHPIIEVKDIESRTPKIILDELGKRGLTDKGLATLQSWAPSHLAYAKSRYPDLETRLFSLKLPGETTAMFANRLKQWGPADAVDSFAPNYFPDIINMGKYLDRPFYPWTQNKIEQVMALSNAGIPSTTDKSDIFLGKYKG